MKQPRVDYYQDEVGEWRWRIVAANGRIIVPPESHTRKADAERAFETAAETVDRIRQRTAHERAR